ncbi:MAG: hypothetical protein EU550_02375 [Promethearchaeota archaeon]|nr:MAG: hypothetical protein EU550_02375 [Candidatus Lokiarchaeota archaeon]
MKRVCKNCKKIITENEIICENCGTKNPKQLNNQKQEQISENKKELELIKKDIKDLKQQIQDFHINITCPMCGAVGKDIKIVKDESRILSYQGKIPIYLHKCVCKKCGYEFGCYRSQKSIENLKSKLDSVQKEKISLEKEINTLVNTISKKEKIIAILEKQKTNPYNIDKNKNIDKNDEISKDYSQKLRQRKQERDNPLQIRCPMDGSYNIVTVDDKSRVLWTDDGRRFYGKKHVCKDCGYEF